MVRELLDYLFDDQPPGPPPAITPATPVSTGAEPPPAAPQARLRERALQDASVRAAVAAKLARILPNLNGDRLVQVQLLVIRALELLARDQALLVRSALAGAIKDVACAPRDVCLSLARDVEQVVAEPILCSCLALTDADLRAIILEQPAAWAVSAIARRERVSAVVADAVYHSGNLEATTALINNPGAEISEPTLAQMVDDSMRRLEWQRALAGRPGLPVPMTLRLASFVNQSVLEFLRHRDDFDSVTAREIVAVARRRLDWLDATVPGEPAEARARRLLQAGQLDDQPILDALSWGQLEFVHAALGLLAHLSPLLVERILRARSPRATTALAWRAGLAMRTAVQLQLSAAGIASRSLLNARGGSAYPLTETEMTWQLERFGIPPLPPR